MRIPESVFDVPTPCVNVRTGNMVVFDARTGNHAKPPIVNDDNAILARRPVEPVSAPERKLRLAENVSPPDENLAQHSKAETGAPGLVRCGSNICDDCA